MIPISAICGRLPPFFRRHKLVQLMLALSPVSKSQWVEFNGGAKLYADISDPFPRSYFLTRSFEPEFFQIAVPFLKKGGVFLDVGANFGFCTFGLIKELPGVIDAYHLFESSPEILPFLEKSKGLYPGEPLHVHHGCISDQPGETRFLTLKGQMGASHVSAGGDSRVKNLVLDQYLEEKGIEEAAFCKMDIEGYEPQALAGLKRTLAMGKIKALYVEVSWPNLVRYQKTPEDCFKPLRDAGYRLYYIKEIDLNGCDKCKIEINGDVLSCRVLSDFPKDHQTDILALHESLPYKERAE